MTERVVIVAMGACTPVGRDAWSSAAAVRAGISGFVQHPYMIDTAGEPMRAAIAPWIDIGLSGADRLEALLFPALEQALEPLASRDGPKLNMAIALGLPSARPGLPEDIQRQMLGRINKRYARYFVSEASFAAGHAAGLIAAQAAATRLGQGTLDACVVAGVESYIEPLTLEWLEANDQLHSAGPLNNAWGFIPGEAGAALLLTRESVATSLGLTALAVLLGFGAATESKRIKTETVCIGEGLTQACRIALGVLPAGAKVGDIYSDMNGEPYRADEYGFTIPRINLSLLDPASFEAPVDCYGDIGSAGGVNLICLAVIASIKGYSKGRYSLILSSSEKGERGVALLDSVTRESYAC